MIRYNKEEGNMINFSIFVFILYAVQYSARSIVFGGNTRRERRAKRRRKARVSYAKRKPVKRTVIYGTKKARRQKLRAYVIYGSCATIA